MPFFSAAELKQLADTFHPWAKGNESQSLINLSEALGQLTSTKTLALGSVYTDEQARDAIGLALVAGANISITVNDPADTITIAATGGGSGITRSISSVAVPTTASAAAATDYIYLVSGTTTLTLPTAVGNTNLYVVKNTGVNTVSVASTAGQTFDGTASPITMPVADTALGFISDGSNWRIV